MHAGTGGVGLAAVNVARALGCRILTTAGVPQKRTLLRSLGCEAVASSRDTEFVEVFSRGSGVHSTLHRPHK